MTVTRFQDLPLADPEHAWDGRVVVVPHAVRAAGGVMQGARGGAKIPADEVSRVKAHLAHYYEKMDDTPPWKRST